MGMNLDPGWPTPQGWVGAVNPYFANTVLQV